MNHLFALSSHFVPITSDFHNSISNISLKQKKDTIAQSTQQVLVKQKEWFLITALDSMESDHKCHLGAVILIWLKAHCWILTIRDDVDQFMTFFYQIVYRAYDFHRITIWNHNFRSQIVFSNPAKNEERKPFLKILSCPKTGKVNAMKV